MENCQGRARPGCALPAGWSGARPLANKKRNRRWGGAICPIDPRPLARSRRHLLDSASLRGHAGCRPGMPSHQVANTRNGGAEPARASHFGPSDFWTEKRSRPVLGRRAGVGRRHQSRPPTITSEWATIGAKRPQYTRRLFVPIPPPQRGTRLPPVFSLSRYARSCLISSRSSRNSLSVAFIRSRLNSLIGRSCTIW